MVDLVEIPKRSPEEIVEDLRETARIKLADIQANQPSALDDLGIGLTLDDLLETEAADCIEDLLAGVSRRR